MPDDTRRGTCAAHDTLAATIREIRSDVKEILRRLGKGDVTFAATGVRMRVLELVVYGACGAVLLYVAGRVLAAAMGE
jgi:hypothetical protein